MAGHSGIVGGSTCGRLLNCPASHQAILALPVTAETPSEYAQEGTAMHAVMAKLLIWRKHNVNNPVLRDFAAFASSQIGQTFHDRILTAEHWDSMIGPALTCLAELENSYGGNFDVVAVEYGAKFPGVAGAFGSVDLILQSDTHVLIVDWKFGQGIAVPAVYEDSEGATVNPQLLFYAVAARAGLSRRFAGRATVVAIIQPRCEPALGHTELTLEEMQQFRQDMQVAVIAALGRDPPMHRGEWCRFAPCKIICPLWTGPLLDFSALLPAPKEPETRRDQVTPYGEYLAKAKLLADQAALFKQEIDEQLHAYLQNGGSVPGWRLKAKVKQRQWVDSATVAKELSSLGFQRDEIWQNKLQTFALTDTVARRLGVKIPEHLRVTPPSSETTIAPTDDPAPVVETSTTIEQFTAALLALKKTPQWIEPRLNQKEIQP
jgi:hypothetical protein